MVLNDVRLTQETGSKCSPAELVINNNRWVCHGRKEDGFGSVFHDKNADISSLGAYVSLVRNSENISPDMVWLVIHPHGTFSIFEKTHLRVDSSVLGRNKERELRTAGVYMTNIYTVFVWKNDPKHPDLT